MSPTLLPGEDDWPDRTLVEGRGLERAVREEAFLEIATELATEFGRLTALLVQVRPPSSHGRDAAILRGLATRIVKLSQRLVAETYEGRGEIQSLLDWTIFESMVDLAYLLRGHGDRYEAFLRHHLRADRAVWEHLVRNREERQGVALPQEQHMRKRVERAFRLAGLELDDVGSEGESAWPSLQQRLDAIGEPRSGNMHQVGAFAVHGLWHELVTHQLSQDEALEAKLGWSRARVEPLFALVIQGSRIMGGYALRLGPDVSEAFRGRFLDLARRAADCDRLHELFVAATEFAEPMEE